IVGLEELVFAFIGTAVADRYLFVLGQDAVYSDHEFLRDEAAIAAPDLAPQVLPPIGIGELLADIVRRFPNFDFSADLAARRELLSRQIPVLGIEILLRLQHQFGALRPGVRLEVAEATELKKGAI